MVVNKQVFSSMLINVADLWRKNVALLGEIDSRFGDGDHGVTIEKIALAVECEVENWGEKNIRELIESLSERILGISGGSAGPLYGTLIGGLAAPLADEVEINEELLKKMLKGSVSEMSTLTKAKVGDKTMMDALIPAVETALLSDGGVAEILTSAAKAAADGTEYTKSIASQFGRARSYGTQTIGTPDAGAVSTALLFQGLCEGFKKQEELLLI